MAALKALTSKYLLGFFVMAFLLLVDGVLINFAYAGQTGGAQTTNIDKWVPFFQTLVWIVLIGIVLYNYRSEIRSFLANITKIKAGPLELEKKIEELDIKSKSSFYYNIGELYRLQKRWDDAEYSFMEAYKINPKYPNALLGIATTLRNKSRVVVDESEKNSLCERSLNYCNDAIRIAAEINVPESLGAAYLTRATVKDLLKYDAKNVIEDLRNATNNNPGIKNFLRKDEYAEFFKEDEYAEFFKGLGLNL